MNNFESLFRNIPSYYFDNKNVANYYFYTPADLAKANIENIQIDATEILLQYERLKEFSLYVDIPFCKSRCLYCNYFLLPYNQDTENFLDNTITELDILNKEINLPNKKIKSLYFGGGTPSILSKEYLEKFLSSIINRLSLSDDCEITLEATPEEELKDKFGVLKKYVNRLSFGIESFNDDILKFLNRKHDSKKAKEIIQLARDYFENINIDLIYGLPNQKIDDWLDTINTAISLDVSGITIYRLAARGYGVAYRREAPMMQLYDKNPRIFPDEKTAAQMYLKAKKILEDVGYEEVLIGFFVKSKIKEVKVYKQRWAEAVPVYGLGLGAYSYGPFGFIQNHDKKEDYIKDIKDNRLPINFYKKFGDKESLVFRILGRLKAGKIFYEKEVPKELFDFYREIIVLPISYSLPEKENHNIELNLIGRAFVDRVAFDIIKNAKK